MPCFSGARQQRSDPVVAVPAGAADRQRCKRLHLLGGRGGRVQTQPAGARGAEMGPAQEQAYDELRETQQSPQVC